MDKKEKKLADLKQNERSIYEAFERGLLSEQALNFELEGIALSESLILNKH